MRRTSGPCIHRSGFCIGYLLLCQRSGRYCTLWNLALSMQYRRFALADDTGRLNEKCVYLVFRRRVAERPLCKMMLLCQG